MFVANITWSGRSGTGQGPKLALKNYARIVGLVNSICNGADNTYDYAEFKRVLKYKVIKYTEGKYGACTVRKKTPKKLKHWKKRTYLQYEQTRDADSNQMVHETLKTGQNSVGIRDAQVFTPSYDFQQVSTNQMTTLISQPASMITPDSLEHFAQYRSDMRDKQTFSSGYDMQQPSTNRIATYILPATMTTPDSLEHFAQYRGNKQSSNLSYDIPQAKESSQVATSIGQPATMTSLAYRQTTPGESVNRNYQHK